MTEDDLPRRAPRFEPLPLDPLGEADLREYVATLQAEIVRVEAELARKAGVKQAAAAFFKTPGG